MITGKLALERQTVRYDHDADGKKILHSSFEKFVQVVRPLYKLEGDADQKELLQLLCDEPRRAESDDQSRHKATSRSDNVKDIPAICCETMPTKAKKAD